MCILCGTSSPMQPASRREPLYRCPRCGLIENRRSQSQAEEESRYLDVVFDSSEEVAEQQYTWLSQAYDGKPARILDVGCGTGRFLASCQSRGWRVCGVELSPPALELARQRLGADSSLCADLNQTPGQFELITLWDVLDHLDDPVGCLANLLDRLAPGGTLLIRVRNGPVHLRLRALEWWTRRWLGYPRRPSFLGVVHRFGFSARNLRALLGRQGLTRVKIQPPMLHSGKVDRTTGSGPWVGQLKRLLQPWLNGLGQWTDYRVNPTTSLMLAAQL